MCPVAVIRAGLDVVATISPLGSDKEVTVPVPYLGSLKKLLAKKSGEASYIEFNDWDDFLIVFRDIKPDDTMWIILSRKEGLSYAPAMARIPKYLNKYFQANSFVLAYPVQAGMNEGTRYLT